MLLGIALDTSKRDEHHTVNMVLSFPHSSSALGRAPHWLLAELHWNNEINLWSVAKADGRGTSSNPDET